jgi:hypothetical protein
MEETQASLHPGLVRVRQRLRLLLSAAAADPLSAAELPAASSWADRCHHGVLSLLL